MVDSEIIPYIKAIDNKDNDKVKLFFEKNIDFKNIVLELYNKGLLTSNRLQFIVKNNYQFFEDLSALIKILLKENNFELLDIIFDNIYFFDNVFIIKLLHRRKNNKALSREEFVQLIGNYCLSTKKNEDILKNCFYSSDIYLINACLEGKFNLMKYLSKLGINVNKKYSCGNTPLFYACKSGNVSIVK
jgi:hypothetical protein